MRTSIALFSLIVVMLVSCKQDEPAEPKTVTFQGNTYEFTINYQNYNNVNSIGGGIDIYYSNLLSTGSSGQPFLGIGYGFNSFADSTQENLNTFFTTGNKTFQTPTNLNGAMINYATSSNTYSSNMASQSGSTFNFTSITYHDANPDYVDYSADFSCKLYDWTDTSIYYPISGSVNGRFLAEY